MTIRLYDSKTQATTDFVPIVDGAVGLYVCGPTVQSSPHIGHLRSALVYDLWRRWLTYRGFDVTLVRNVTDIDDKILANSTEREEWWALAYRIELEFTNAYNTLGILPPTYEPRATASIGQMQEIIERLIEHGHAYPAEGDVYFDTKSWPGYGALTHQNPDNMEAATDADPRGKRAPQDFALWKGHKSGEPSRRELAVPVGRGASRLAHRVLGDVASLPRCALRHHGGGSTCAFRTTRTSSPSRRPRATSSRTTGCTTDS